MQVILETERLHSCFSYLQGRYLSDGKYNNRFQGADQYCTAVLPGVFAGILYALSDRWLIRYDRRNHCTKNEYGQRVWSEI